MTAQSPRDELALIQDALAGDPIAATALLNEIHPVVRGVVRRICFDRTDIDDIVQHVYVALFSKALRTYRGGSLRAFVASVARTQTLNYLQRKKIPWYQRLTPSTPSQDGPLEQAPDPGLSPEERVSRGEDWAQLQAELQAWILTLTPQQQDIAQLWLYGEQSPREIAQALGLSPDVVRATLTRLRKRMKPLSHTDALQEET